MKLQSKSRQIKNTPEVMIFKLRFSSRVSSREPKGSDNLIDKYTVFTIYGWVQKYLVKSD